MKKFGRLLLVILVWAYCTDLIIGGCLENMLMIKIFFYSLAGLTVAVVLAAAIACSYYFITIDDSPRTLRRPSK